jgi:ribonuclease Z
MPTALEKDLLIPTRKTYTGPLELGEDLMAIEVADKVNVRRPARSSP